MSTTDMVMNKTLSLNNKNNTKHAIKLQAKIMCYDKLHKWLWKYRHLELYNITTQQGFQNMKDFYSIICAKFGYVQGEKKITRTNVLVYNSFNNHINQYQIAQRQNIDL